jgi:DNA uptake protein ComE-like DNA-binding protein
VQAKQSADPKLGMEVAAAYQQLGALQETTTKEGRQSAVQTYQKSSGLFNQICEANPGNTAAQERLVAVNLRIRALGAQPPVSNTPILATTPEPEPVVAGAPPKPVRTAPAAKPAVAAAPPPVAEPPVAAATPPARVNPNAAQIAELQEKLIGVSAKVQGADQQIGPLRLDLERRGQALNANTEADASRMKSSLDRARRNLAAGNLQAAEEDLAAADAFATRVLRTVGR